MIPKADMTMSRPIAMTEYIARRIESALADAEYARLIADRERATRSLYEAFGLHGSLLRLEATKARGAPVNLPGHALKLPPRNR